MESYDRFKRSGIEQGKERDSIAQVGGRAEEQNRGERQTRTEKHLPSPHHSPRIHPDTVEMRDK